jgi:hypothetical protein
MPTEADVTRDPTVELALEALREMRELITLEIALAREELRAELGRARVAAVAFGIAAGAATTAFTMFLVTIATALAPTWLAALVMGAGLLVTAGVLGYVGFRALPRRPLAETRERLESDVKRLRERIA